MSFKRIKGMKYISGVVALNIPCSLDTCGDWHRTSIDWKHIKLMESDGSYLGDWGIEKDIFIPELNIECNVANTLRACIDLLITGNYISSQGMKNDFICNDKLTPVLFDKVYSLKTKGISNWAQISYRMGKEYGLQWLNYLEEKMIFQCTAFARPIHSKLEPSKQLLQYVNLESNNYILKGRSALILCYSLDSYSEIIDLDGTDLNEFMSIIEAFCNLNKYKFSTVKDNSSEQRYMLFCPEDQNPLEIVISQQESYEGTANFTCIDGIRVYSIDRIARTKSYIFAQHEKIIDLYDILFICSNYFDKLTSEGKEAIGDTLKYKGWDQLDYLIRVNEYSQIDKEKLLYMFGEASDKLGLLKPRTSLIIS